MRVIVITILFAFLNIFLSAQSYPLIYENDFEKVTDLSAFDFTDANAWKLSDTLGNKSLELYGKSYYEPSVRSPLNIALIRGLNVGSFILEVDLKQTGREYGHRDMCLFFNVKDPSNFYYVHLASVADPNAHNIFLVNDEPRRNIATKTTEGISWGERWNKVKIIRNTETGTIKVFFNDMETPIMEAEDHHFKEGSIGFGSFDDTGMIDNIKIWGETLPERKHFFR